LSTPLPALQLDITDGVLFIQWIVFSNDGTHKVDSKELPVKGAPVIMTPPTLEAAVIGQVTTGAGQEARSLMPGCRLSLGTAVRDGGRCRRPGIWAVAATAQNSS
jgi:hypothetical protein